jgi:hypothetical protein
MICVTRLRHRAHQPAASRLTDGLVSAGWLGGWRESGPWTGSNESWSLIERCYGSRVQIGSRAGAGCMPGGSCPRAWRRARCAV